MERATRYLSHCCANYYVPFTEDLITGHMGVYYAEKVAQYSQNPKLKRPDLQGFRDVEDQMFRSHDLDFSKSRDIIGNMTIQLPLYDFL